MKIRKICDLFLVELEKVNYNQSTILNYRRLTKRFQLFCENRNVDEYTLEIGQEYANDVVIKKTGKTSVCRYKIQGRFIRLLNSYYDEGVFDFSCIKRGKVKPTNCRHAEIYKEYSLFLETKYSNENTLHFYKYGVYILLQYLNKHMIYEIEDLTSKVVINFFGSVAQSLQRASLCSLRAFLKYLSRTDLLVAIEGIHAYRHKMIIPTLTDEEIKRIKAVLESKEVTYRDAAIILLGLSTGIRACDLINLKLSNIDWINETISFKQKKTGNFICLPLTTPIGNSIAKYIYEERPKTTSKQLFIRTMAPFEPFTDHSSCYSIVERVFKLADISKNNRIFGMHMLRHNAASTMIENEVPIPIIAAVLGHSSTDSTDIYITTDKKKLKTCVLPMIGISKEVK